MPICLQNKGWEHHKVTSLLRSLHEISTLEIEFEEVAKEKRKHQLAMEMEVVGIVEHFTAPDEFAKKEAESVKEEEVKVLEALMIKMPIEGDVSTVSALPDPLPRDLSELRLHAVESASLNTTEIKRRLL